jgi:peptidoglycan/xylan/chitin deacetylase (PgdA/CDA1 family)
MTFAPPLWPNNAPFALFLSHDVDQVYDRGLYRTLSDINHLQQMLWGKDYGNTAACCRRIGRSLLRPKGWRRQFERILEIESAYGWRSTFFFLEGNRWSRYGSRYSLENQRIHELASLLTDAGCEIGVHGSYYDFNKADGYRRSADIIEKAFKVRPVGIRNHHLRFSYPLTLQAQAQAGFLYDSTFGMSDQPGFRDGRMHPFIPKDPQSGAPINIVVLPLTVMDSTLFRVLGLGQEEALRVLDNLLDQVRSAGGLLTLLWHNNYFDEPEYRILEEVYAAFLGRVAKFKPFCGTGAEIAQWYLSHKTGMEA